MNAVVLVMLFAVSVVVNAEKDCRNQERCASDECCVAHSLSPFSRAECKKLAKEGHHCVNKGDTLTHMVGKYVAYCPCAGNLTCEPERVTDLGLFGKVKVNLRCTSNSGTTSPGSTTDQNAIDVSKTTAEEKTTGTTEKITTVTGAPAEVKVTNEEVN